MATIRHITRPEEFRVLADIQKRAWGFTDADVEPHQLMTRIQKYGGLVQGLFLEDRCIGFTLAVIGSWNAEYFLYSHMAAVLPEYQGRGYGTRLKEAQRGEALRRGYRVMRWNFDPLQSRNAYFNLHRLGVVCDEYETNIYGVGESGLHAGLPTDRLIATWELNSARVRKRLGQAPARFVRHIPAEDVDSLASTQCFVEIPKDIQEMKRSHPDRARAWQEKLRTLFTRAFAANWRVEEIVFSETDDRPFYQLVRD